MRTSYIDRCIQTASKLNWISWTVKSTFFIYLILAFIMIGQIRHDRKWSERERGGIGIGPQARIRTRDGRVCRHAAHEAIGADKMTFILTVKDCTFSEKRCILLLSKVYILVAKKYILVALEKMGQRPLLFLYFWECDCKPVKWSRVPLLYTVKNYI